MKSRIEELAMQLCVRIVGAQYIPAESDEAVRAITAAVNEALELAAKECEKETKAGSPAMWISAASKNAEAIRKLKLRG